MDHKKIIELLSLKPLSAEGGFFRETYRSDITFNRNGKQCCLSTAIFYLLREGEASRIHKLKSDEIWHFYLGDPLEIYLFKESGGCDKKMLGVDIENGEMPQILIPKNCWQGAKLRDGGKFALMGTTVSPAFEESDFEMGVREKLISLYPEFAEIINCLT
jgi:uncharacterized protein